MTSETARFAGRATRFLPVAILAVVLGFAPGYLAALDGKRASLHVHGALMMAWMLALFGQAALFASGRLRWHRRAGRWTLTLAPLMVASGLFVTSEHIGRSGSDPSRVALEIFSASVATIVAFGLLVGLAMAYRRRPAVHARLMLGTALLLFGAGILRILLNWVPGFSDPTAANHGALVVGELCTLAWIAGDRRSGRGAAPLLVVLGLQLLVHGMVWVAPGWGWWRDLAVWCGKRT